MSKPLTNEQMLRKLIKEMSTYEAMIIRERLVKIAEITLDGIKKNPEAYDNPIFDHEYYAYVCDHIIRILGFETSKKKKDGTNV